MRSHVLHFLEFTQREMVELFPWLAHFWSVLIVSSLIIMAAATPGSMVI